MIAASGRLGVWEAPSLKLSRKELGVALAKAESGASPQSWVVISRLPAMRGPSTASTFSDMPRCPEARSGTGLLGPCE